MNKREKIVNLIFSLSRQELVEMWNESKADMYEGRICPMEEFNEAFKDFKPLDLANDLAVGFDTADAYFYYDGFAHSFTNFPNVFKHELIDRVLNGDDCGNERARKLLAKEDEEDAIKRRVRTFAMRILPILADECASVFTGVEDVDWYINDYVEKRKDNPEILYLACGYENDVDANIYIKFDARLMRYQISFDWNCSEEVILEVGDLVEEHFSDFDREAWMRKTSNLIKEFERKRD